MTKYKLKDLKTYNSTEWLAENKKKYRQVFDRYESAYIYAELSLYNKEFDRGEWSARIELKCYYQKKTIKEICHLSFERKISPLDPIAYIREGWGNKRNGSYWRKGTYYWEAWIDGILVATKYFYVEESKQRVFHTDNYLRLLSVKLYEASFDNVDLHERVYLKVFESESTRYIFSEINFENKNFEQPWYCEMTVRYFNESKQLKGQASVLQWVHPLDGDQSLTLSVGSNLQGTWTEGTYYAEILFMDQLLATVPFEVSVFFDEGLPPLIIPHAFRPEISDQAESQREGFQDVMQQLEELTGLEPIKQKVRDHANYLKFIHLRKQKGYIEDEEVNVHSVFVGNPGTGKTTVARMMGKLYRSMGLLSKGHVHEVDRSDLVGEFIGQTAPKVKDAIEAARGGVLFIDEAYALARSNDDSKDFGREVIEILIKEMSNGVGDLAVIVAGYPKEMQHFLKSNPGLKSRFKMNFDFPDYLPEELMYIAELACKKKSVVLSTEAKAILEELVVQAYRNRDKSFGNARFVFDLIQEAKVNLGLRIMQLDDPEFIEKEQLSILEEADLRRISLEKKVKLPNLPIDEKMLREAMAELNALIGMEQVKADIQETVRLVRFYRETGRNVLNKFYLHSVLLGNPGTGKTTVARILTKIYKALGVLERGQMIETDRQGLVAGYVGQTAIKTAEKIDESIGGVLFIDEAYALTSQSSGNLNTGGDFGNESIQTLLKRMEDQRGQFFVFVAGYPDLMEAFLKANPGLKSRFDKFLKFEDYSPSQLFEIGVAMLNQEGLTLEKEAATHLSNYFHFIHEYRDKYFGNARTVRNTISEIIKKQNLRLSVQRKKSSALVLKTIVLEDLSALQLSNDQDVFDKKMIGFRSKSDKK